MTDSIVLDLPLSRRLKDQTRAAHEALDQRIMGARPFESRDRYARFVRVQHRFHEAIEPLYEQPRLAALFADLPERSRLAAIEADLADLQAARPDFSRADRPGSDPAEQLGWLYVAEGSNLGAAFLLKEAKKLDLDETFGARHLAGHPEGRGLQWRRFVEGMDGAGLDEAAQARAVAGAEAAFNFVRALVEEAYPD